MPRQPLPPLPDNTASCTEYPPSAVTVRPISHKSWLLWP